MEMKPLNKIGLYTKQQMMKYASDEVIRQSQNIQSLYKKEKEQTIDAIDQSVKNILSRSGLCSYPQYLSITPFCDSMKELHWLSIKIYEESNKSSGTMEVQNFWSVYRTEGHLYFDIYNNRTTKKPFKIHIVDFVLSLQNREIGSYLLNRLDFIAHSFKVEYIYGELSTVDFKNRDAQVRFYSRNGYTVKPGDKDHNGSIRKDIT
ncbi:MAG TPA: hypothetical protein DD791_10465 [Syntrophomonas sp.]|jgi:hypothetical protein|nr:hypothetical protein [Syntrophomonas sp.]